jgi:nucleoside-diphosphate-sugar epimerase
MSINKILIIGANGQIGTVLTAALKSQFGTDNVIPSDIKGDPEKGVLSLDVLDATQLAKIVDEHKINEIYHLAAVLSAKGEQNPKQAWNININGLFNVLEVAKEKGIRKIFFPSTIAVFGANIPLQNTPQHVYLAPSTVYGISKVAGELWSEYYSNKYNMDIRSVRYPGVIGYQSLPGGGTTDYAVDIYHKAIAGETFECFLSENTTLPMIYMDDVIRGTIELMNAPEEKIKLRSGYNLAGMSFSPKEIYASICKEIPDFKIVYKPDFRQAIADSWPQSIDDSMARANWGWKPKFDLDGMTKDMLFHLRKIGQTS